MGKAQAQPNPAATDCEVVQEESLDNPLALVAQKPERRRKSVPGLPPRAPCITLETVNSVAPMLARGMPLRFALASLPEPIPVSQWNETMSAYPRLSRMLDQRIAHELEPFFDAMNDPERTLRNMPAKVWLLERRFPSDFAQPRAQDSATTQVNVQVNLSGPRRARVRSLTRTVKRV